MSVPRVNAATGGASTDPGGVGAAEINLRIAHSLARWIRDHRGTETLDRVAEQAELTADELDGSTRWVSLGQFEALLAAARELTDDDEAFRRACAYRLAEGYGPMRFLFWALSPAQVYAQALSNFVTISTITRGEVVERGPRHVRVRVTSSRPESRLMCLSRQGQAVALPTLWGLPDATLTEGQCIGRGDSCCEYEIQWYQHRRWLPTVAGLLLGLGAAALLDAASVDALPIYATLPLLGGLAGALFEVRRTHKANLQQATEIHDALQEVAREDAAARRELLALHQRQREWSRLLEEQVAERTTAMRQVVERIQELRQERVTALRGYSHDLRNPLTAVQSILELMAGADSTSSLDREDIDVALESVRRIVRLLDEMLNVASADADLVTLVPQPMDVAPLTDKLRRRLRALVLGRDIRISVLATREAPERIVTDLLLFDRVVDNLLTNAARYTERGSIVVQLDGRPGSLVLQVSDTGCGIEQDQIERIFRGAGGEAAVRTRGGHGVGLSVVVRLLAQVGGKLEVMSLPGKGTTFWALLPVDLPTTAGSDGDSRAEAVEDLIRRVVTIRREVSA